MEKTTQKNKFDYLSLATTIFGNVTGYGVMAWTLWWANQDSLGVYLAPLYLAWIFMIFTSILAFILASIATWRAKEMGSDLRLIAYILAICSVPVFMLLVGSFVL